MTPKNIDPNRGPRGLPGDRGLRGDPGTRGDPGPRGDELTPDDIRAAQDAAEALVQTFKDLNERLDKIDTQQKVVDDWKGRLKWTVGVPVVCIVAALLLTIGFVRQTNNSTHQVRNLTQRVQQEQTDTLKRECNASNEARGNINLRFEQVATLIATLPPSAQRDTLETILKADLPLRDCSKVVPSGP